MPSLIKQKYYQENREKIRKRQHDWYIKNRERILEKKKEWKNKNPDRYKFWALKANYNLSKEEYLALLKHQNFVCAICEKAQETLGRHKSLSVDHCHSTGNVRGLLCNTCNRGIGLLKDSPEILESALAYLRSH